jgi:hypothetical protein
VTDIAETLALELYQHQQVAWTEESLKWAAAQVATRETLVLKSHFFYSLEKFTWCWPFCKVL